MSLVDYVGRRYDALAFRGQVPTGRVTLEQNLFSERSSGEICTGIQKLAQRWLIEFLTEVGSLRYLATRGCEFMTELRQGKLRTEADVVAAFRFSAIDIKRNLLAEETASMPDDERLANAELLAITVAPGTLELTIQIISLAGDTRQAILPLSTLP